jgi:hypothetical protein
VRRRELEPEGIPWEQGFTENHELATAAGSLVDIAQDLLQCLCSIEPSGRNLHDTDNQVIGRNG